MIGNVHRYPHMVQEYYVQLFRQARRQRLDLRAALKTRNDALKLQDQARAAIKKSFGPLPPRTPLNPRVTGKLDRPRFSIEKVLFDSRPGFTVSANLYIPKGLKRPAPCVLGTCGHSVGGKAEKNYQSFCQGLVLKGFVVLIFDPISQGERVQYPNADGREKLTMCPMHTMTGDQQSLIGEFFGTWRAWDGIRALDYLLTRPEVDRRHVGVTGNSGGGTMTAYLPGLDERITMAAPGCWVTTLLCNLENECPGDGEQIPPGLVKLGLDEFEILIPHAPKPLILLTAANDFFDQRGCQEVYQQLRRVWKLLGAEDNLRIFTSPGQHGYVNELRQAMYGFFTRHSGMTASPREPALKLEDEKTLLASPSGSVVKDGAKRVFDFTSQAAREIQRRRPPVPAGKLPALLRKLLAMPNRNGPVHYRVLRPTWDDDAFYWTYSLETEPGIQAIVTLPTKETCFRVPPGNECTLLVPHLGGMEDILDKKFRKQITSPGRLFAVDVRGMGESLPATCNQHKPFDPHSWEYFYNAHGLLLGQPYLGRRVHDVLCTIDWLRSFGYRKIHLIGRGMGGILAVMAGCIDGRVAGVTSINGLLSYFDLTQTPIIRWPGSAMALGILKHMDLDDCHRALGAKLTILSPWDARMKALPAATARKRIRELGLK